MNFVRLTGRNSQATQNESLKALQSQQAFFLENKFFAKLYAEPHFVLEKSPRYVNIFQQQQPY